MSSTGKVFTGPAILAILALAMASAQGHEIIGTFGPERVTDANLATGGTLVQQAHASLLSHFPSASFASTDTLTPAFLSGIDMLMISSAKSGTEPITPLSTAEQSALFNFVKNGGDAFLIMENYDVFHTAAQSVVSAFGMRISGGAGIGLTGNQHTTPTHPIFMGPFGTTPGFLSYGGSGFDGLGRYATGIATTNGGNVPTMAVIEAGAIALGSGRVVLVGDGDTFMDSTQRGFFAADEKLFLNTIAYLVPEPTGVSLAITSAISLAALRLWRPRVKRCVRRAAV